MHAYLILSTAGVTARHSQQNQRFFEMERALSMKQLQMAEFERQAMAAVEESRMVALDAEKKNQGLQQQVSKHYSSLDLRPPRD